MTDDQWTNTDANKKNNPWRYAKIITPIVCIALTIAALCVLEFALAILTVPIGIGVGLIGLVTNAVSPFLIERIEKHHSGKNQPMIPS